MSTEYHKDGMTVSSDPIRLDPVAIHAYLTRSYWAEGIPLETVRQAIDHSLGFGLYDGTTQVGFARAVTDRTTYAWIADVYVLEDYRGRGLSKWLMECVLAHPDLQGLRRISLATRDAHELYRRYGFEESPEPGRYMHITRKAAEIYGAR